MSGCNLDYRHVTLPPNQSLDRTPETTLIDATHIIVRNGSIVAKIQAALVENYPLENRYQLKNVRYEQFNNIGETIAIGSADLVSYNTKSKVALISGTIVLRSESHQAWIRTNELLWDLDLDLLSTTTNQTVTITRDDNSGISGSWFRADLRNNTISFSKSVIGSLIAKIIGND